MNAFTTSLNISWFLISRWSSFRQIFVFGTALGRGRFCIFNGKQSRTSLIFKDKWWMAWKWVINSRIGCILPVYIMNVHFRIFTEVFDSSLSALGWWSLCQSQTISSCCKCGSLDINRRALPMIEHDCFQALCPCRWRNRVWTKLELLLATLEYWRSCLGDFIVTLELKYFVALCNHALHTSRHGRIVG